MSNLEIAFDAASLLIGVVGLLIVIVELRKQSNAARDALRELHYQSEALLCRAAIDHPELLKFYVGQVRHDDAQKWKPERCREVAMCDLVLDQTEHVFLCRNPEDSVDAEAYVHRRMGNSSLRRYWRSRAKGSFNPDFERAVEDALTHYAKIEPNIPPEQNS